MATNLYLEITDGTTTVTIANGNGTATNYIMDDGWGPVLAGLRTNELVGRGPRAEVVEELELNITGATASAAYDNLSKLALLLDQAERWARGEIVNEVVLKYSPRGGTVTSVSNPLTASILGRAPGDQTVGASLPVKFHEAGRIFVIRGVRVRFVRVGHWEHTSANNPGGSNTNGSLLDPLTQFPATVVTPSRTWMTVSNFGIGPNFNGGFLLVTERRPFDPTISTGLAPNGAGATGYTSVNDSANFAIGTNVLRYTPSDTTERVSNSIFTPPGPFGYQVNMLRVFASIRNNSSTTSFAVRLRGQHGYTSFTPTTIIPPFSGSAFPLWYNLGILPYNYSSSGLNFLYFAIAASAASGSLDINNVYLVDVTSPSTQVLAVLPSDVTAAATTSLRTGLFDGVPTLMRGTNPPYVPVGYLGNVNLFTTSQRLNFALLATGSDVSKNTWVQRSGGVTLSNTWTFTRTTAYITPQ